MPQYRVAVVGGGIAGLCLAAALGQLTAEIHVDVYESAPAVVEVGAGLTLWGRVCEVLRYMGLEDACTSGSVVVASSRGAGTTDGMRLRGFRDDTDYGRLPFRDAWSLHRTDLIAILARLVPQAQCHFRKRLVAYHHDHHSVDAPITLTFSDATTATCDVLVGADGIRSVVRAQLMAHAPAHVHPRWTGTLAYRALVSSADLTARNPEHRILKGGAVYCGKSKHIVGYPISPTTLNLAINTTNLAHVNSTWPPPGSRQHSPSQSDTSPSPSPTFEAAPPLSQARHRLRATGARHLDRTTFRAEVAPSFEGWGDEVDDIIQCIDTCMEWPVLDLDPLPFYHQGRVVLIGDAAHAAVPYVGAGAAFAIEDSFLLAHLLHAAATPHPRPHPHPNTSAPPSSPSSSPCFRPPSPPPPPSAPPPPAHHPLTRALHTYTLLRHPRGNALVRNARLALRCFQFDGPCGGDMARCMGVVCRVFEGAAGVREVPPPGGTGGGEGEEVEEVEVERMELEGEAGGCGEGPVEEMRWGVARVRGLS